MNPVPHDRFWFAIALVLSALVTLPAIARAQQPAATPAPTPGPMLDQGFIHLETPEFTLDLVRSSQTVAALKPKIPKINDAGDFDFTPGDLLKERSQDGYYHLGDLDLRLRAGKSSDWKSYSTALARRPVTALPASAPTLAAADLSPTLPPDLPLQITRTWAIEERELALRFTLKNKSDEPLEIWALGIPMIFNNVRNNRSLEQAYALCSLYDPYIGEDAGYLQVTRLRGQGPALLVVPDGKTPFEAYNPIQGRRRSAAATVFTDATPRGVTFEGFYEWMIHSLAYVDNEWKKAQPWNPPTTLQLSPGESKTYGLKFLLADSIRNIESTLAANHRPVALGVPGYVLPMDIDARLFLKYSANVKSMTLEPEGAIKISRQSGARGGWKAYALRGQSWGRSRLTITYDDGLVQTISYFVIKPSSQAVADMGRFMTTKQWFVNPNDPFHRSPSIMSYDREANEIVMQDSRVWIAGLGDEGGSGGWVAAVMKELGQPKPEEIAKLEQFVDAVLWGGLQFKDGPHAYGVRKSLFYYQPDQMPADYYRSDLNWKSWTSWNKQASELVNRSFNYPHV